MEHYRTLGNTTDHWEQYRTLGIIMEHWKHYGTRNTTEHWQHYSFFLGFGLSREFFLATVLLHLHCLLFGVLGWVSVQHFEISADVRRAI